MPTITTSRVQGYAHCRDSLCPGNEQEPVAAIREQADIYYKEWDPDAVPGVMNSTHRLLFADQEQIACPTCGEWREITDQQRPVYPVQINAEDTDQRFLLKLQKHGLIHAPGSPTATALAEQLRAGHENDELEALRREVAELRGFVRGQASTEDPDPDPKPAARKRSA